MGGIIAIYTKMCMEDFGLQTKILGQGYYDHLVTLVEDDDTRHVALRALNSIALTTGKQIPPSFRRGAPRVLEHALKHLDEPDTLTILTGMFAHATETLRASSRGSGPFFDVAKLVRALLAELKKPQENAYLFDHAMVCFTATNAYDTMHACDHIASYVTLMIALLRCKDFHRRCQVLYSLDEIDLIARDLSQSFTTIVAQEPKRMTDIATIALDLKVEDLPESLQKAADKHGRDKLFMTQLQRGQAAYAALFVQYDPEVDLLAMARAFARVLYEYEYPVPGSKICNHTARVTFDRKGGARHWIKLAERCFKALRAQDAPSHADLLHADILELMVLQGKGKSDEEVYDFTQAARTRHPQCPLFYHVHYAETDAAIRLAKKGLKCPDIPAWIRLKLTILAASAADRKIPYLSPDDVYPWLVSARADAKWIMDEGPPDDFQRCWALETYILMHLTIEGPSASFKAPSVQRAIKELEINAGFMKAFGEPIVYYRWSVRRMRNLALMYRRGQEEWAALLSRVDEWYLEEERDDPCKSERDPLVKWMSKLESWDNLDAEVHEERKRPAQQPRFLPSTLRLMTCSWCSRPSVILKQCSACGQER
ncbi:hypothetical protein PsYK624_018740 [Phanerochaete sordida]|uniref:Uncharacterized protein n=1 Tax=Phanerochaete sordida TaxID=48140 RepID=A0A9P3L876_9APHY|nr:hypothetical protein PsYK624_018740 [Phanerochaete sordida]